MTFSFEDSLSVNEILSDVLNTVDDKEHRSFSPGWYRLRVKEGLDKLNYYAPFIKTFKDFPMPDNLILPLPSGAWDIADIYLWNGEDCIIEHSTRVFHKSGFYTHGRGTGYTARKKPGQRDIFIPHTNHMNNYIPFYNIHMGSIVLSDICANFDSVRVYYNGTPSKIDDVKMIPPFVRDAIAGYVIERYFFAMKSRDAGYRVMWLDAKQDLYIPMGQEPSKWDNAISKIKKLDKKHYDDLSEYLSQMNY